MADEVNGNRSTKPVPRHKIPISSDYTLSNWLKFKETIPRQWPLLKLTRQEVSQHSSPSDCWVILDGMVYNISPYLPYHPGGIDILLEYAGQDISGPFRIHPLITLRAKTEGSVSQDMPSPLTAMAGTRRPSVTLNGGIVRNDGLFVSSGTKDMIMAWLQTIEDKQSCEEDRKSAIKQLRNKLLGHENLKRYVISGNEFGLLGKLSSILRDESIAFHVQKEACVVLGSLAYGGTLETQYLIDAEIPTLLFEICSKNLNSMDDGSEDEISLAEAALSALRTIYRQPSAPKELPFQDTYLAVLANLIDLNSSNTSPRMREYSAVILANCCNTIEKQHVLIGYGVLHSALALATSREIPETTLNASLDLLASLTKSNQENVRAALLNDYNRAVSFLFDIVGRKVQAETRILAGVCLTNLCRASTTSRSSDIDIRIFKVLLPGIVSLLDSSSTVKGNAAQVLALLISENEQLQVAACDQDVIARLSSLLHSKIEKDREAALIAFAALSSTKEECRRLVIEARILPAVISAMESLNEGLKSSACQCARSLSRSVKNLRTTLVDAGIADPLMKLLRDPSILVQKTACAVLCNLVLDFSPLKEIILRQGGVDRLVELLSSSDGDLRFNAVWALKNLLYLAETEIKEATIEKISFDRLEMLIQDPQVNIREQAMNLIRNMVCEKEQDIGAFLNNFGQPRLIRLLENALSTTHEELIIHSCYVIANICTTSSSEPKTAIISNSTIMDKITSLLVTGRRSDLQQAALWCIINLTWTDDSGSPERIRALKRWGVENKLEALKSSGLSPDTRDRVQTALNNFHAADNNSRSQHGNIQAN